MKKYRIVELDSKDGYKSYFVQKSFFGLFYYILHHCDTLAHARYLINKDKYTTSGPKVIEYHD